MNLVENIAPIERATLKFFAHDVQYLPQGALAPSVLRAYTRRLNPQELLAAAIQQGVLAVIDAVQFTIVTGKDTPRRYDRMIDGGISYSVERWDGSPAGPPFVFFKISLLGGQQ